METQQVAPEPLCLTQLEIALQRLADETDLVAVDAQVARFGSAF